MASRTALDALVDAIRSSGVDIQHRESASLAATGARWDAIETRLGWRMPEPLRTLVRTFHHPMIELDHLLLFGNADEPAEEMLETRLFADHTLSTWLIGQHCLHIGHPGTGSYDPVCLDLSTRGGNGPAVVIFDHEAILLGHPRVRREVRWPSLLDAVLDRPSPSSSARRAD